MRLLYLFLGLATIVIIIFLIWGDPLMEMFSQEGSVTWLTQYGSWAWLLAIILLMADLLLPLPATIIMSAVGYLYGPVWGGLISAAGSFVAGAFGYWLCRLSGEKLAIRLLGENDYERGKKLFSNNVGGLLIVFSRWLPVLPEVMACMAGLTRMPVKDFHVALACGSLPLGFVFAYVGHFGVKHPVLAVILSAAAPVIIYLIVRPIFRERLAD
jgi:uncharacterized membrane protein YdjX (TVP38/TMEM64 family)